MSEPLAPCVFVPQQEPFMCSIHPGGYRAALDETMCRAAQAESVQPLTPAGVEEFDRWAESRKGKGVSLGMLWALRLRATLAASAWLIERGQPEGQTPTIWWVDDGWTDLVSEARRYTRAEAEAVIARKFTPPMSRGGPSARAVQRPERWTDPEPGDRVLTQDSLAEALIDITEDPNTHEPTQHPDYWRWVAEHIAVAFGFDDGHEWLRYRRPEPVSGERPCSFGSGGELALYCSAHGSARLRLDEPGCHAMARKITLVEAVRRIAEVKAGDWSDDARILADVIAERLTDGAVTRVAAPGDATAAPEAGDDVMPNECPSCGTRCPDPWHRWAPGGAV